MANPFGSSEHRPIAPGRCRCGKDFPGTLALDTHILGPELAEAIHRDRTAALDAIQVRAAGMCEYGCHVTAAGMNADFDCPVHGGMREVS